MASCIVPGCTQPGEVTMLVLGAGPSTTALVCGDHAVELETPVEPAPRRAT